MPPKFYPKLGRTDGQKGRIRKGYVPLPQLTKAINGTADLKERTVLKVIYFCALRASEPGLQPLAHFDSRRGSLDILRLKGSNENTYMLEPWVLNDMRAWMEVRPSESPYIFPHPNDPMAPLDRHNVLRYWTRAADRAGLGKDLRHPHVLKHSIATHMLERGDDVLFVQDWIGHKSLENTQVYAELVGKRLTKGQAIMKELCKELE